MMKKRSPSSRRSSYAKKAYPKQQLTKLDGSLVNKVGLMMDEKIQQSQKQVRKELAVSGAHTNQEFTKFKTEMGAEFAVFKTEIGREFRAFKTEMRQEFSTFAREIRSELRESSMQMQDFIRLNNEHIFHEFRSAFGDRTAQHDDRLTDHENRIRCVEKKHGLAV